MNYIDNYLNFIDSLCDPAAMPTSTLSPCFLTAKRGFSLPKHQLRLTLSFALTTGLFAQDRPKLLVDAPKPAASLPKAMRVCAAYCSTFTPDEKNFLLRWPEGQTSLVTVESFTEKSVVLHRLDPPGTGSAGLKVLYVGKFAPNGKGVVGTATFIWPMPGVPQGSMPFVATWDNVDTTNFAITNSPIYAEVQASRRNDERNAALLVLGLMGLAALLSSDGPDDRFATSGFDRRRLELNEYRTRQNLCAGGDAYACRQIHPFFPDDH